MMQLEDFKRIKHRGGIKNFFPFLKNSWNLTEGTGSCSVKKGILRCMFVWEFEAFWIVQSRGTLTKLGALLNVCLLALDIDVFWIIIWRANSKQPDKIRYWILVKIYIFSWDNTAFLYGISLLPENKALFFSILQKQSSRGVLWPATLLKRRLWRRCFPVNFVKFLGTPSTEHLRCLLLILTNSYLNRGGFLFTYFKFWISWNEIYIKLFPEIFWKKYFTLYPRLHIFITLNARGFIYPHFGKLIWSTTKESKSCSTSKVRTIFTDRWSFHFQIVITSPWLYDYVNVLYHTRILRLFTQAEVASV